MGDRALKANTTGTVNCGFGYASLFANTTGNYNTGIGGQALFTATTASNNTAVGYQALVAATTGSGNVAIGGGALGALTTTNANTVIGYGAGGNVTTGVGNTIMGEGAVTSGATDSYTILIGRNNGANITGKGNGTGFLSCGSSGSIYQGNNSASWATTSDQRLKKNIVSNDVGLEKLVQIQVRNFEYRLPEEITELPQAQAIQKSGVQLGVIAQELQAILPECVKTESTGVMTVDVDNLTWYMINAIKELKAEFDAYKASHP
jgi:hypothetical protein